MAVRNRKKCRNCPEPVDSKSAPSAKSSPTPTLAITCNSEGDRLWKHVLFGTSTCISMIEGYARLGMPGDPRDTLVELRDRISKVINHYEVHNGDSVAVRPAK